MSKLSLPNFDICSKELRTANRRFPSAISWRPEPGGRAIDGRVVLWRGSLDVSAPDLARFNASLSSDELARAARFRFEVHRDRFIAGRGLVRSILAGDLDREPRDIAFEYSRFGKPVLKSGGGESIHFNLAHSEDQFALAVSDRPVGVDLELIRPIADMPLLAKEVFSDAELSEFKGAALSLENFLRLWTRKEALLKGIGCGITEHVKKVSVFYKTGSDVLVPNELSSSRWLVETYCDSSVICSIAYPMLASAQGTYSPKRSLGHSLSSGIAL